jgi:hypothetical protein
MRRFGYAFVFFAAACSSKGDSAAPPADAGSDSAIDDTNAPELPGVVPAWLSNVKRIVAGADDTYADCRTVICRHNEDTDLVSWNGAIWLVHRTAISQILGPNSALHVYKSTDDGATFAETARVDAPADRDVRDPHFYIVGGKLHIKALTRVPGIGTLDANTDTIAVETHSDDGATWSPYANIGPAQQSFWRIKEHAGVFYSAAYSDGDTAVTLFSSTDGVTFTKGPVVWGDPNDIPSETELVFMPSGKMLALVRTEKNKDDLLGDKGPLSTKVCWADAPYASFTCPQDLADQRLDGPLAFFSGQRLFVVARKHLLGTGKKRTALYEIGGTLEGGPLTITEKGELPSAGDTAYAGVAFKSDGTALLSWYSGRLDKDEVWAISIVGVTNIWQGAVDFTKL